MKDRSRIHIEDCIAFQPKKKYSELKISNLKKYYKISLFLLLLFFYF